MGKRRGYVICSEPRSGTHYLCQLLSSTGKLGHPLEYFNTPSMRARVAPDYPADLEGQFLAIMDHALTDNDVYGVKMFTAEFDRVRETHWAPRLPNLKFIHFERLDYVGQAISEAKAIQTGVYRSSDGVAPRRPLTYDRGLIRRQLESTARGHARWRMFFSRNDLQPLRLTYEALLADPADVISQIAAFMGLSEPVTADPAAVRVQVQRDETTQAWRERFLAEEAGLDWLDRFEKDTAWAALRRRIKPR